MPGAILKKFMTLEKDFNAASMGRAMSPEMKKARNILSFLMKMANVLDTQNDLMSGAIAKAERLVATDLQQALATIKIADEAHKKFAKALKNLAPVPKITEKILTDKEDLKAQNPVEYRALKVISTDSAAFASYCAYIYKDRKMALLNISKKMTSEDRIKGVTVKAMLQVDKAVKRAKSAIQKIKAKPTNATWDDQFKFAGRDVKMALVTLIKAQKGGQFQEWDPMATNKYFKSVSDWDTQKKESTLKKGATEKDILMQLKKFSFLIKNMSSHYNIG